MDDGCTSFCLLNSIFRAYTLSLLKYSFSSFCSNRIGCFPFFVRGIFNDGIREPSTALSKTISIMSFVCSWSAYGFPSASFHST